MVISSRMYGFSPISQDFREIKHMSKQALSFPAYREPGYEATEAQKATSKASF